MSYHLCATCGRVALRRSERKSFLERFIYALFNYYPWTCKHCGTRVVLRDRGQKTRPVRSSRESSQEAK